MNVKHPHAVPTRHRLPLSILCGLVAAAIALFKNWQLPYPRDFGQIWFAARAVLHGVDPYPLMGPGRAYEWYTNFVYPIPAAFVGIPFTPLSLGTASVVFAFLAGAAFAWALMEYGYGPLFGFFGAPMHHAAVTAQWSPLFAAALVLPPIGLIFLAKPTIGAALFAARPSRWAIVGGLALAAIAFIVRPTWIADWLAAVAENAQRQGRTWQIPVLMPGGVLALLALTRWRRPEARLIAALACVPQTPTLYEVVPLFLVAQSFWEAAALVGLSHLEVLLIGILMPQPPSLADYLLLEMQLLTLLIYVPAMLIVLRRPNEGPAPGWLERRLATLPTRMRGAAA